MCANTQTGVTHQPAITFWSYLLVRVLLGVLTAASLMMFEGAVMATIQGRPWPEFSSVVISRCFLKVWGIH